MVTNWFDGIDQSWAKENLKVGIKVEITSFTPYEYVGNDFNEQGGLPKIHV